MNENNDRDKGEHEIPTPPAWKPPAERPTKPDDYVRDDKPIPTTSTGPRVEPDKDKGE